ncbi:hypothetical protein F4553_006184 [Allocatelliglobosispora scoriae]|uniref:Uncharacterized protein n=1 Tax=Allocatelliglobosispora scoriae TaxID=643052 RepID=A0A841C1A5_9ACTN|nr:hypothetical protein [Allocatelliglobosispora scoriae]MBB5872750.1 hypothetical protein [Allocatelliglobosispora scoriae]
MITQSRWGAAEALGFGRADGTTAYDEIGARIRSAAPRTGPVPLQTIPDLLRDRAARERTRLPDQVQELLDLTERLAHRPIELPRITGRIGYEVRGTVIHLTHHRDGAQSERWSFPLSAPPTFLTEQAQPDDQPPILTQTHRFSVPGAHWLPLRKLIAAGRVVRMQQWRGDLVTETEPAHLYLFISHRWLGPEAPDPEGQQAAMIGWQVVAAACEAARVAFYRGLHQPRLSHPAMGLKLGVTGSDLAEAIVVNVLRPLLDEASLAALHAEVAALETRTADRGVAEARVDTGLSRLRELLMGLPALCAVLDRILVWYDYGCMPQRPHVGDEEREFQQALRHLSAYQATGRTAILLDDADAHLTRAWCTLEALVADNLTGTTDLLVGSHRAAARSGEAEHFLLRALADRPHLVWRALLDTEVFGLQTPEECLTRLGLTATHRTDLPLVYEQLLRLGGPSRLHTDDMEVVTGSFPLPVVDRGATLVVPVSSSHPVGGPPPASATIDWTGALRPGGRPSAHPDQPSWQRLAADGAHVAIVAACEGEAVLIGRWIHDHLDELARAAGGPIGTMTWLASDIAPVGHLPDGSLRTVAVDADRWLLVTTRARLQHCAAASALITGVTTAGYPLTVVAIDGRAGNIHHLPIGDPGDQRAARVATTAAAFVELPGGVFRAGLTELLGSTLGGAR